MLLSMSSSPVVSSENLRYMSVLLNLVQLFVSSDLTSSILAFVSSSPAMEISLDVAASVPVSGVIHADPTLIAEASVLEASTLANLREYRHKDVFGNEIGEYLSMLLYGPY